MYSHAELCRDYRDAATGALHLADFALRCSWDRELHGRSCSGSAEADCGTANEQLQQARGQRHGPDGGEEAEYR